MASDAPIRAALRAAVDGYDAARMAAHGEKVGMSDRNKETITPMIAAAVRDFLLALPGPGYVGTPPRIAWITPLHMQNLADEVARAAEGEG